MADGFNASRHDGAMESRDEEQLQPLNPSPVFNTDADKAPPVTSPVETRVQYLPVGADEKATIGTEPEEAQLPHVPNQQVREILLLWFRVVLTINSKFSSEQNDA